MKSLGLLVAGFVAGFVTLFVLILVFGEYEDDPAPQVVVAAAASTSTPLPTETPIATTVPTETPAPLPPTAAPTLTPHPTPIPPGLNTDIVVGDVRWRALRVEELGSTLPGNDFVGEATTPGKFVRVFMEVESRRAEPERYEAPALMDAQGRRYEAFDERFFYLSESESCYSRTFNPNLPQQCADLFEVAPDAGGYKLVVNNLTYLDTAEAVIELR